MFGALGEYKESLSLHAIHITETFESLLYKGSASWVIKLLFGSAFKRIRNANTCSRKILALMGGEPKTAISDLQTIKTV